MNRKKKEVHTEPYIKRHFKIGNQASKLEQKQQKEKKKVLGI
jgi:hypothetical protein